MDLVIVGMGRAGGSLARASAAAGHRIVGILSRRPFDPYASLDWDRPLPPCDLALISVSDGAISQVADRLAANWDPSTPAVHISGFSSTDELAAIARTGAPVGSFHPLQSLPDPERGAAALAGSWAAVTAGDDLRPTLEDYATSLGMRPFVLADDSKARYHAAAAAGANYVVAALGVAIDLLDAARVPAEVMEPLTRRVVENVFASGAEAALTGPVARGDLGTVAGQQAAAESVAPELGRQFRLLTEATALRAGVDLEAI